MPLVTRTIQPDADRISLEWSMAVTRQRLWWGLTDPEALPHWLGRTASGRFSKNDVVVVQHAEDYFCTSHVQEYEPERLLGMTWKFPDEELSYVRIVVVQSDDGIGLTLEHHHLGSDAETYLPGWHTHLLYLESLLLGQPRSMDDFWSTYEELDYP